MKPDDDTRLYSPAAERNRQPILQQLRRLLPPKGRALEIASGTGQHVVHFAAELAGWQWQPSEADDASLASIEAWRASLNLPNLLPPIRLDLLADAGPPEGSVDLVFCANMIHIAPWAACSALLRRARRWLVPSGHLVLYGPFLFDDVPTAESNLAFDADLRRRNPAWGIRHADAVSKEAAAAGLHFAERVAMPANNVILVLVPEA